MKRNSLFLTVLGATLLLSACGNKGDLVLPPAKPAKPQPAPTPPTPDAPQKLATSP
jgi:predicted small lipoprotein YifL